MKYSLAWLGKYVDLSGVDLDHLVDRVTLAIAEVEGAERVGEELAAVRIVRVTRSERIGDDGELSVCEIEDGEQRRQVVCGAPNVREGMLTAYAPPSTRILGKELQAATIHGVRSEGMLCSPAELELSEDAAGICELPDDLQPGTLLADAVPLMDTVFEVDNKSITHRPDLWGYVGMAREIAAQLRRPLKTPSLEVELGRDLPVQVVVDEPDACPRYAALGMEVPAIVPSPLWLQTLLFRSGVRPISNVVDLTNYVMLEWGNPVHAFDATQLRGGKIHVRFAEVGEAVQTLDGEARTLADRDLLICDGERPVALAGIMGLANSEITLNTRQILLEVANFRADIIRRSATRLKMRTEASARFEKSLDPELPSVVSRRFAHLLLQTVPGSRVTSRLADAYPAPPSAPVIPVKVSYINQRLGETLTAEVVEESLAALEFKTERIAEDELRVTVPSFRATRDISIPEDLIEEIGRMHGYDNIQPQHPEAPLFTPHADPGARLRRRIRLALSLSDGFTEIQSYSFDPEPLLERIGRSDAPRLALNNPISADATHLRPHILPGLIGALERNLRTFDSLRLYEIGRIFVPNSPEIPIQPYHLGIMIWQRGERDWTAGQHAAIEALKSVLADLFFRLRTALHYSRIEAPAPWLHPARCATLRLADGTAIGHLGALHPEVCETLECGPQAAAAEIDLQPLEGAPADLPAYETLPRYPAVPFDLSIVVPEAVTHGEVYGLVMAQSPTDLRAMEYVGIYRGGPIPDGEKSLTYRLIFQSHERTLAMEEVRETVDRLVASLKDKFGAWLRT